MSVLEDCDHGVLKNTKFRKLGLVPSSVEMVGASTVLNPLERTNLSYWSEISSF